MEILTPLYISNLEITGQFKSCMEGDTKMESDRVSVEQAAKELGVSQQFVRITMQRGELPIGIATKLTGNTYMYLITRGKLDEFKNTCRSLVRAWSN